MTNILKGLAWATAMIGLALATNAGLVDRGSAEPLFLALPVLAVLTISNARAGTAILEHRA